MSTEDKPAPSDDKRVRDVIDGITSGSIGRPDRKLLRDTLDKAEAPSTGRKAQDEAANRAIGGRRP